MKTYRELANDLLIFTDYMKIVSVSANEATTAFNELAKCFNKIIPQEYRKMELKLMMLKSRLSLLEGRTTECANIKKKISRQIRNLEAKMALN